MSVHRRRIVYTDDARSELSDILLHSEQAWGKKQRVVYGRLIRDTISWIARSPSLGRSRSELSQGLRSYPVGSHVLFYWERDETLIVAHILHGRRDPENVEWST